MRREFGITALLICIMFALFIIRGVYSMSTRVVVIDVSGIIDAGTYELVKKGIDIAEKQGAEILVMKLNTYGGYMSAMDDIIEAILNLEGIISVAWVPSGSKAVSAGTFIALACDKLFMGRGSVIGACEPRPRDEKVLQYALGRMRSLAERKWGLNDTRVKVVEEFIIKNRALSDEEAIELGIADGRADSLLDVLEHLNVERTEVVEVTEGMYEEFLSVISDPSIAILLIITGLVLIGFELIVTGFQGWGIIGTILAILGLYGLGLIGTSLLILTLTAAGIAFLIAELAQPGLQIFGGTGLVLLLIAMALAYRNEPYVSATHMMAIAIALLALTFGVLTFLSIKIRSALRRKPKTIEDLVGKIGIARTRIGEVEKGVVYLEGEEWSAVSVRGWIEAGSKVKVVKVEGLTLVVEKEDKS